MAEAKKCDRCGKFYMLGTPRPFPEVFIEGEMTKTITRIGNAFSYLDMCDDCWNSFGKWWETVKNDRAN